MKRLKRNLRQAQSLDTAVVFPVKSSNSCFLTGDARCLELPLCKNTKLGSALVIHDKIVLRGVYVLGSVNVAAIVHIGTSTTIF